MLLRECRYHLARHIHRHLYAVGIRRFCQVFDSQRVMLRCKFHLSASFLPVNKQFIVLRTFHADRALHVVLIIHKERKDANALAVFQRWKHLPAEHGGRLCRECQAAQQALLIKLSSVHIHGIHTNRSLHSKGTCHVKLRHRCLHLRPSIQDTCCQRYQNKRFLHTT